MKVKVKAKKILVVYHSQEKGNTHKAAKLVAKGCTGVPGVKVRLYNVYREKVSIRAVEGADGLALGSPDYFTYIAGNLKQFFDDLKIAEWAGRKVTGKPCVCFLTHGGGGGGIHSLNYLAEHAGFTRVSRSLVCEGAPTGKAVERAKTLGRALAEAVVKGKPKRPRRARRG